MMPQVGLGGRQGMGQADRRLVCWPVLEGGGDGGGYELTKVFDIVSVPID